MKSVLYKVYDSVHPHNLFRKVDGKVWKTVRRKIIVDVHVQLIQILPLLWPTKPYEKSQR